MRLWVITAIVLAGVSFGSVRPGLLTNVFPHVTLYVFLPPLLFEAAWNLHWKAVQRHRRAIVFLAVPGVAITAVIVAGALYAVRVPFVTALLTGAILSATDPIAIVAAFRRIRAPIGLRTIVESEALLNDAVAVMLYRAIVAFSLTAGGASVVAIGASALLGSVGGVAIGVSLAFGIARLLRHTRSSFTQIAATLVCAYGAYFLADDLHASGLFAAIAAGIALRRFERPPIGLKLVRAVGRFWEYAVLAANVAVFFLVGAAIDVTIVARKPAFVLASLAAIWISRYILSALLAAGYPRAWRSVINAANLRSALSVALALALPKEIPDRAAIVASAFAVAIATTLGSNVSVAPVLARALRRKRPYDGRMGTR